MRAAVPGAVFLSLLGAAAHADDLPRSMRLSVDTGKVLKERARPKEVTPVSLVPGGPPMGEAPFDNPEIVIGVEGRFIRIVAESWFARVAYYLEDSAVPIVSHAGAVVVSKREAALGATRGLRADAPGVRLNPGIDLGITAPAEDGVLEVHWAVGDDHGTGFIAEAKTGRTYVPGDLPSVGKAKHLIDVPAELLDGPGGTAIASIGGAGDVDVRRLGQPDKGYVRVALDRDYGQIVGWVAAAKVEPMPPHMGRGIAGHFGFPHAEGYGHKYVEGGVIFDRGTILRAAPHGLVVGVLKGQVMFNSVPPAEDGYVPLDLDGPFGQIHVYARPPDPSAR